MIAVENLVKHYGQVVALKGVSFEVPSGQVLGFLGPNGAGKTTTMKILTGFLYPTSGTVTVDGLDVVSHSLEVRERVGYLPENNPLYGDMRVDDYLRFVGEIRGLRGSDLSSGVDRVTSICGLPSVYKKSILELSKGFRQRVGLAQAMVHDPEILILDEPTSGLDPNQIIEIRELIRSIGSDRTVILSTHILQEVEAAADNIMIITDGRLVAEGTLKELTGRLPAGPLQVDVLGPTEAVENQMKELFPGAEIDTVPLPEAERAHGKPPTRFHVHIKAEMDRNAREAIYDLVKVNGWKLLNLHRDPATLEQVFRKYTVGESGGRSRSVEAA